MRVSKLTVLVSDVPNTMNSKRKACNYNPITHNCFSFGGEQKDKKVTGVDYMEATEVV